VACNLSQLISLSIQYMVSQVYEKLVNGEEWDG